MRLGRGPHLETLLVDVLPARSTAPDDRFGAVGVEVAIADGAVPFNWLALASSSASGSIPVRFGCEDGAELGAEQRGLVDEIKGGVQNTGQDLYGHMLDHADTGDGGSDNGE